MEEKSKAYTSSGSLKAIVELTDEEYAKQAAIYSNLKDLLKTAKKAELINYSRNAGHAHYTFTGSYTKKLCILLGHIPTYVEILMIVDGGFSHFGASCTVRGTLFYGRVNID